MVGEAGDCASALDAAQKLQPQIVLVDVYLPDADGFDLTSRLRRLPEPPTVVITSSRDGAELEECVCECGACGFVPKSDLSRDAIDKLLR